MYKTTIMVTPKTRDLLKKIGQKGQSYEDVVVKLLDIRKKYLKMNGVDAEDFENK